MRFVVFILLITSITHAQENDCTKIHVGKFQLNSETSGITEIIRTKDAQFESNSKMNIESKYDIVWINDCTYELRNRQLISGSQDYDGEPTDIFTVEILKIEGAKIYAKTSSNFADLVVESQMEIKE